jgi:hypothetical protein
MNDETLKIIARYPNLKEGVVVAPDVVAYGSARVEIRKDGFLCWRMFEFENDFAYYLDKNLKDVSL